MADLLTQAVLDGIGCSTPDCGHDHSVLFLHASCHPKAALEVRYVKALGALICECARCHQQVGAFAVAAGPQEVVRHAG